MTELEKSGGLGEVWKSQSWRGLGEFDLVLWGRSWRDLGVLKRFGEALKRETLERSGVTDLE